MNSNNSKNILVVDDEDVTLKIISTELEDIGYTVDLANDGEEAFSKVLKRKFDLVLLDVQITKIDGMTLLKKIKETSPSTLVIMMTAYGSIKNAVEAMKLGAYDYLEKPFENNELVDKIEEAFKIRDNRDFNNNGVPTTNVNLIGVSKEIQYIRNKINKVKDLNTTVLITGDSGTGKGVVARLLHYSSNRSQAPFVNVNCAVLPENLIESELFGHEKGSFTGAYETKKGKFEVAKNGTIFLDEIGTLPLNLQTKLLTVLQDRCIERLGGNTRIPIEARIIAATNKDLEYAVKNKEFREDLYYRLNVINIECPPLKHRKEDILLLIDHFIEKYNKKFNKNIKGISEEAKELLLVYEWSGNVRELENTIESSIALTESNIINIDDLPPKINTQANKSLKQKDQIFSYNADKFTFLEVQEIIAIKDKLKKNNGHRARTAEELGISRRTLQYKLKKYDLIN